MSRENNGGQAFPRQDSRYDGQGLVMWQEEGMTLRDYFAAKAMLGLLNVNEPMGAIPRYAYELADAMLKAREAE